jgi:2-dehydro-3-deoxygluconokinase
LRLKTDFSRLARMRIASLGECMVELSPRPGSLFGLGFGGDTLNTAVYLARLGMTVDYVTAMGDDALSDRLVAAWAVEGVGTGLVRRVPGRMPGLYLIETDDKGERRFHYWRDRAPARELFDKDPPPVDHDVMFLSGVSLAIWGERGRAAAIQLARSARRRGGRVAFDNNYRPRIWPDAATARDAMLAFLAVTDVALLTLDDEQALHGGDAAAAIERARRAGVAEIVIKDGQNDAWCAAGSTLERVPAIDGIRPVDTTGAGDSFDAGFLAARLSGAAPAAALRAGHALAAAVIQHPGAIIPMSAMPKRLAA